MNSVLWRHLKNAATNTLVLADGNFELNVIQARLNVFEAIWHEQFANQKCNFA